MNLGGYRRAGLILAFLVTLSAMARRWEYDDQEFDAELVGRANDVVVVKLPDGRRLDLEFSRLSDGDRAYLARLAGETGADAGVDSSKLRVWRSTGGAEIEGEFIREEDGFVYLQRSDGRTTRIRLDLLSAEDNAFVAERSAPPPPAEEFPAPTPAPEAEMPRLPVAKAPSSRMPRWVWIAGAAVLALLLLLLLGLVGAAYLLWQRSQRAAKQMEQESAPVHLTADEFDDDNLLPTAPTKSDGRLHTTAPETADEGLEEMRSVAKDKALETVWLEPEDFPDRKPDAGATPPEKPGIRIDAPGISAPEEEFSGTVILPPRSEWSRPEEKAKNLCLRCKADINEEATACEHCGLPFAGGTCAIGGETMPADFTFCPKHRAKPVVYDVKDDFRGCLNCGRRLRQEVPICPFCRADRSLGRSYALADEERLVRLCYLVERPKEELGKPMIAQIKPVSLIDQIAAIVILHLPIGMVAPLDATWARLRAKEQVRIRKKATAKFQELSQIVELLRQEMGMKDVPQPEAKRSNLPLYIALAALALGALALGGGVLLYVVLRIMHQ